jgi:hypothetical protein
MNSIRESKKLIKKALRRMPDLPFDIPYLPHLPRRRSMMPYILGAIGVALMGGITALMIFSPRTRYRALGVAKDAYGKAKGQLEHIGVHVGNGGARNVGSEYVTQTSTGL